MTIKIAINGLGRIGRCVLRAIIENDRHDIEVVAVNGPAELSSHVHLLKYDSVHGAFRGDITTSVEDGLEYMDMGHGKFRVFHERKVSDLPWGELGVDVVLECTGKFTKRDDAALHIASGAKKVLISAPASDADATIVYGVNNEALLPSHTVLSVGSCTTNALAPVAKVLNDRFGIKNGFMTTVHAYTGDQNLHDGSHKDLRRARAAALSMVPSSTGAAKAIGLVLPQLKGKINGTAVRVPTPNVSLVDLVVNLEKSTTADEVNAALREAAAALPLKGVLGICDEPLVSTDFNHSPFSSVFDTSGTVVTDGTLLRVASWYDNEWGFSCRMLDVTALLQGSLK